MGKLADKFNEGNFIALRLAQFTSKQGKRTRVIQATTSEKKVDGSVLMRFDDIVEEGSRMGFTEQGVFIPAHIMTKKNIQHHQRVTGLAVINCNKKRGVWSWKALSVDNS